MSQVNLQGGADQTSRPFAGPRPVAAVAVVALRDDAVLLVRRGKPPHEGQWSFPGGSIEAGETAAQAAIREAREETGLDLEVLEVVDVWDTIHSPSARTPGFHYCVAEFLAAPRDDRDPIAASDATAACWAPLDQLGAYEISAAMRKVLSRALEVWSRRFPSGRRPRPSIEGLWVITADSATGDRSHIDVARAAVAGGASVVQLRDKRRDAGEVLEVARRIRELTAAAKATFIVNDRVDVAAAAAADGVHLGASDLPVAEARRILGPWPLIGFSPESEAQARAAAEAGADYLGVGPIYATSSKADAGTPVGPDWIRALRRRVPLPVVAIGGITASRIAEVMNAGATGVAALSAVGGAADMDAATRELARAVGRFRQDS